MPQLTQWIFTHSDCDGICAGAIVLAVNPNAKVFFTHPYGLLDDLENVKEGDGVIICDIALSEGKLHEILEKFSFINNHGELVYIDHHPLPEGLLKKNIPGKVIHKIGSSSSELAYIFFQEKIDPLLNRVAIYGAIADYLDKTPIITNLLCGWDKRRIYFETGILVQGLEGKKGEHDFKRTLVSHLAENIPPSANPNLLESAIKNTHREEELIRELKGRVYVKGSVAYVLDVAFSLGKAAIYARALTNALIGLAGERKRGIIDVSLRTCYENIDLNKILRRITPSISGSGGGHPQAAGARIPEEKIDEFLNLLNEEVRNYFLHKVS